MMTEQDRGKDRAGRRAKRFLTPSEKYEIWLQIVRQEVTIAEAAEQQQVDRSTIMRIRAVAKEGALAALAASKPGVQAVQRDYELEAAKAEMDGDHHQYAITWGAKRLRDAIESRLEVSIHKLSKKEAEERYPILKNGLLLRFQISSYAYSMYERG